MTGRTPERRLIALGGSLVATLSVLTASASSALAHAGSLAGGRQEVTVPTWLVLVTGGAAVGASFLLASVVTDRTFVRAIDDWRGHLPGTASLGFSWALRTVLGLLGLGALVLTVVGGVLGPSDPLGNVAILLVWVGWWAGYTATTYLLGNTWPAVNPWRTLAGSFPRSSTTIRRASAPGQPSAVSLGWSGSR